VYIAFESGETSPLSGDVDKGWEKRKQQLRLIKAVMPAEEAVGPKAYATP